MGLHFVLCSMEKSEKHSHSEWTGLHFILWSRVIFIYFQFLRKCFKDANVSAIIQNPMAKPVGFLSRESRATLTSGLANTRHPSTTLYCKNICSSWMIMHEFILYSAIVNKWQKMGWEQIRIYDIVVTTLRVCVPLLLIEWEGTGQESRGLGGRVRRLHARSNHALWLIVLICFIGLNSYN